MDPKAVIAAQERLSHARLAVAILNEKATTMPQATKAWIDFLSATSAIYSKLEQGTKANNKSSP